MCARYTSNVRGHKKEFFDDNVNQVIALSADAGKGIVKEMSNLGQKKRMLFLQRVRNFGEFASKVRNGGFLYEELSTSTWWNSKMAKRLPDALVENLLPGNRCELKYLITTRFFTAANWHIRFGEMKD